MSRENLTAIYVKRKEGVDVDTFQVYLESIDGVKEVRQVSGGAPSRFSRLSRYFTAWTEPSHVDMALFILRNSQLVESASINTPRSPSR